MTARVQRKSSGRPFSSDEDAILRSHYPTGGSRACLPLLPGRTVSAISHRAVYIGVAARNCRWTVPATEQLRQLTAQGLSTAKIGAILGISRNAVIGKCGRLGLSLPRRSSSATPARSRQPKAAKAQKPQQLVEAPVIAMSVYAADRDGADIPVAQRKTLVELAYGDCRYPCGDPLNAASFFFCGGPAVEGRSYCSAHCAMVFRGHGQAPSRVYLGAMEKVT